MTRSRAPTRNRLLAALSPADLVLLEPNLELVPLTSRQVLEATNKPIAHSYFIERGIASTVARNGQGKQLEVGLIGFEGMTGIAIVLGQDRSPNETFVQIEGEGRRIASDGLRASMQQSPSLQRVLLGFAYSFLNQTASTALSNGTASVEERLARWLLMAHDRLEGDAIPLTHELLSLMLGVRRAGVTVALNYLERRAVISLSRGKICITDREGLRAATKGAYRKADMPAGSPPQD